MTPEEKHQKEAAAVALALLSLSKKARHGLGLALLGASRGSRNLSLPLARNVVESRLEASVGAARANAQRLASEAFARQAGIPVPIVGKAEGSGFDAAASLADQWAAAVTRLAELEGDTIGLEGWYEKAAKSLEWAATRTATQEVFSEFSNESRAAFDSLAAKKVAGRLIRVWKAQLEACEVCAPLHDEEADETGSFPWGDPQIHFGCLCFVVVEVR